MNNKLKNYGKLLGQITDAQLQAALDEFNLGKLKSTKAIPFGLFGQNLFVNTTDGKEYVLRTHAHYDWQLPTEQFFCQLIQERTKVPAPWPYLFSESEEIFGFMYGFAIMPRIVGQSLANPETYNKLTLKQKENLADVLAATLHELQKLTWPVGGKYNPETKEVEEFDGGYIHRTISRIRENLNSSASDSPATLIIEDKKWLERLLEQFNNQDGDSIKPVIVHEDYNRNNLNVEFSESGCHVTGIFDLMTCHFGDGLADLPRQFGMFVEDEPLLARRYLRTYLSKIKVDESIRKRLMLYLIDERLLNWAYFHRPEHISQWKHPEQNFRKWIELYLKVLSDTIS